MAWIVSMAGKLGQKVLELGRLFAEAFKGDDPP